MIFSGRHSWRGETGEAWRFSIAVKDEDIPDAGGIYVMVKRNWFFQRRAVYIGKASNLRSRLIGHERWPEAKKIGATRRHYLCVRSENKRRRIEEDLIRHYKPQLNDILKPKDACDAPNHSALKRRWMCADEYWGLGKFAPEPPAAEDIARSSAKNKRRSARDYYRTPKKAA